MASDSKNVKLGVCQVIYNGVDLGYTQGGVEVTVKTDTHKVTVDQFGKTTINEYIMGRDVTAKVPLAETTLDNLVAIMPGATMTTVGGAVATGTVTIASTPAVADTLVLGGTVWTFTAQPTAGFNIQNSSLGVTAVTAATAIVAALTASADPATASAVYSNVAGVITVKYGYRAVYGATGSAGTAGNSFTLVKTGTTAIAVSAATLQGGTEPTSKSVSVTTGVGTDMLNTSKELRLHPTNKSAGDKSDDFVIPLAATAGALNFAYKVENERIFNVDFNGYPDVTGKLFSVGI